MKSKIISQLKKEEIQRFKMLPPSDKIRLEIEHSDFIRSVFGAGLKTKGFTQKIIDSLWINKHE